MAAFDPSQTLTRLRCCDVGAFSPGRLGVWAMFAILLLTAAQVASPALPPTAFEPLAKLVGHCWRAVIGKDTTDRHCFEAIYGGTHIKDAHVVSAGGRAVYSGE